MSNSENIRLGKKQESIRDYDEMRRTTCCNCPAGCGMKIYLKDGVIVDIFGDETHPINKGSLCPKGMLTYWHLRSRDRTVYPQVRERLDQPFRKVTWKEAMDFVSDRLNKGASALGKNSLIIFGDETAPFEYMAPGSAFAERFGTVNGPYRFMSHPLGKEGSIEKMFGVPASQMLMNTPADWSNSECILLYRSDLAASDPITFGRIMDASSYGTTIIVLDSRNTITSSKATLPLRVNPGTEPIVLKYLLGMLMKEDLIDKEFLEATVPDYASIDFGYQNLEPEDVSRCTGITKIELDRIIEVIGKNRPIQVIAADWNSRRYLSDEELFLCGAIVCLRGSVGMPGGGLNLMNVSPFPSLDPAGIDKAATSSLQGKSCSLSLEQALIDKYKISTLIWYGNPCSRMASGVLSKEALSDIPLIVHLSSYPNETFHYSHVSFPMSSWIEYSGLVTHNNGRAIQWHNGIVNPPGECGSPLDFWADLALLCGMDDCPPFRRDQRVTTTEAADFFLKANSLTSSISVERLNPEINPPGGILWPCTSDSDLEFEKNRFIRGDIRGKNILFIKSQRYPLDDKRFPTPDGMVAFASGVQKDINEASNEHTNNEATRTPSIHNEKYPMSLITSPLVDYVEEYGYFVTDRNLCPGRLMIKIHPRVGNLLGVKNGDELIVENDYGKIPAPVWLSDDVDLGVVWCPEGADPFQPHFNCESFRSLFDRPDQCSVSASFTKVTIYKQSESKAKTTTRLLQLLDESKEGESSMSACLKQ